MPDSQFSDQQNDRGDTGSQPSNDSKLPANEDERNQPGQISGETQPAWRPTDEEVQDQDQQGPADDRSRAQGS